METKELWGNGGGGGGGCSRLGVIASAVVLDSASWMLTYSGAIERKQVAVYGRIGCGGYCN